MTAALTTLASAKAWAGVATTNDDVLLTRLIAQASRMILAYLQRPALYQQTYTETYDGTGGARQFLRQWPVLSVAALAVGTTAITAASTYGQAGWTLDTGSAAPPGRPQALNLSGYRFDRGLRNVAVTYTAGYAVPSESWTVPAAPSQVTALAPYGSWMVDQGVTYATGGALTPVLAAPGAGQYAVAAGVYTFNAADVGKTVLLAYSYVPADLEQACLEIVAERYRYKDRIGHASKSLGGQETVAFSLKDMPDYTKLSLQPYRNLQFV